MSRFLFYFFYWYSPDEPLKVVLDFDSGQKAHEMLADLQEEILYHMGEEQDLTETNIQLIEPYGLRPFSTDIWSQELDLFVSKYGNEFVIIDLKQPTLGFIEHIRPRAIGAVRPRNIVETNVTSENWSNRTKLELRLITSLIRWLQFTQKRNWLTIVPDAIEQYNHRVWQATTIIPDTDSYSASWKIILPASYPEDSPKLFISVKDIWIVEEVDETIIWKEDNGKLYYLIPNVTNYTSGWSNTMFLADWILSGFWNFLARELKNTFNRLWMYKNSVSLKSYSSLVPDEESSLNIEYEKGKIKDLSIFFTWFCQRIPEKANEALKNLLETGTTKNVFIQINWHLILKNLDEESLELFYNYIKEYFISVKEQITETDIELIQSRISFLPDGVTKELFVDLLKILQKKKILPIKIYKA